MFVNSCMLKDEKKDSDEKAHKDLIMIWPNIAHCSLWHFNHLDQILNSQEMGWDVECLHEYFIDITVTSFKHQGISNHWQLDCTFNWSFWLTSKKYRSSALLALCVGNLLVTGGFPSHRASNAESTSMSWRHHEIPPSGLIPGLRPGNERRRYKVTSSLISWAQAWN